MDQHANEQLNRIYRRNNFNFNDIKYITHTNQRTYFHLNDGREVMSTMPLKSVLSCLPALDFWSIQKGIIVAVKFIVSIDDNFIYTMSDGAVFQGRSRNPAEHKRRRRLLQYQSSHTASPGSGIPAIGERCSMFDKAPFAFSVIELIFSEDGRGMDFVFRYCNEEMASLEGKSINDMIGRSFYEVFPQADRKWIVPYTDVAMNGTRRTIHKFSPSIQKNVCIQCYQPLPGLCACIFLVE